MKAKITALILTRDEQEMIEDCLKKLDFVDEIIVMDQNSKDRTVKIASKYTGKIIKSKSDDFAKNRNALATYATGDWLLYIDADERLSPELESEIKSKIEEKKYFAYYIPRKNFILGKFLKHGGWWPDYVPRLIKRDKLIKWQGKVHESPKVDGQFGYLENSIDHLTARSLEKMLDKSIRWAKVEAELYYHDTNPNVTIPKVIIASLREFISRYIFKLGFLDGRVGFIAAMYQLVHRAMIMTYLWELQNH